MTDSRIYDFGDGDLPTVENVPHEHHDNDHRIPASAAWDLDEGWK